MNATAARDPDYAVACAAAGRVIDERVSGATLGAMHEFLCAQADAPAQTVLHRGAAWGGLHEQRTGRMLSPGLTFERPPGEEEQPWAELLSAGAFSADSLSRMPRSFNVSPGWVALLERSARNHGATWLHHLHLGVARLEAGAFADAQAHFLASLKLKENAPAERNLALLRERDGDLEGAQAAYERAWPLCGNDANLAVEFGGFLTRHKRQTAFKQFVKSLPAAVANHERLQLMTAQIALEEGDYRSVRRLLQREFCTIREGEVSLTDLWFQSHLKEAEARQGRALTSAEKQAITQKHPPPRAIDFRMR